MFIICNNSNSSAILIHPVPAMRLNFKSSVQRRAGGGWPDRGLYSRIFLPHQFFGRRDMAASNIADLAKLDKRFNVWMEMESTFR